MSFYHLLVYTNIRVHKKKNPIPSRWSRFISINKYFIIFLKIWSELMKLNRLMNDYIIQLLHFRYNFKPFKRHLPLLIYKTDCFISLCCILDNFLISSFQFIIFFSLVVFNQMIKPCSEFLFQWLFYNSTKLTWLFFNFFSIPVKLVLVFGL